MAELGEGLGTGRPSVLDTRQAFTNGTSAVADSPTRMDAEVLNDALAAIVAEQTELGNDYSGASIDLATRIAGIEPTQLFLNETVNTRQFIGLTIRDDDFVHQGFQESITLRSDTVVHDMTDLTDPETYGSIGRSVFAAGGIAINGYADADGSPGLAVQLTGFLGRPADTTKTGFGVGVLNLEAFVTDGIGGADPLNTDGNILTIGSGGAGTTKFIFDTEGQGHSLVVWTTFHEHDDVGLLEKFDRTLGDPIGQEFGELLTRNRPEIEALGLATFEDDGCHAMVNFTKLSMLLVGGVVQTGTRVSRLEEKMDHLLGEGV